MLFVSGLLLLYSAVVVPFQICMWDYSDPCNTFPTLHLDIAVDTFFLASSQCRNSCPSNHVRLTANLNCIAESNSTCRWLRFNFTEKFTV